MPVLNEYEIIGCTFLIPYQEDVENMTNDKIPGKTGEYSEPDKNGDPNLTNLAVLIEHDIAGHTLLIIP